MKIILLFLFLVLFGVPAYAEESKYSPFDLAVSINKKIRCGYLVYPPYIKKDPNTKKLSGIFYDVMEEIGKNADVEIEWTEEVGYDDIFPGLSNGRFDAFCGGLWPNTMRAKVGTFSIPVFYSTVTAWGRVGDKRFKDDLDKINEQNVRIAVLDGAQEDIIARTDFPKARRVSKPSNNNFTDNFLDVQYQRADVTFAEPSGVAAYIAANPKSLEQISSVPLRTFGNVIVVRKGAYSLKEFFDVALTELLYSGKIEKIVQKYELYPGLFLLPSVPYEVKR
jgi:ABC-type amino acid transport substrate-binding protein